MSAMKQTRPSDGLLDMLVEWVGSNNVDELIRALTVFLYMGSPTIEFLIRAAVKPGMTVEHQRRLLDLAQRIGGPLNSLARSQLQLLCRHGDSAIRPKAKQVLDVLRQYGPARRQSRRLGLSRLLGVARRLAAARKLSQGSIGASGRQGGTAAGGKPIAAASQPHTS